jgi:carotenoid cleavage dioxygenase-like enzyme
VLAAFPLVVNPLRLATGARPFIENYRWRPELGTKLLIFDRRSGELRGEAEAEPRFAFHHVNAFEQGSELLMDLAAYDDATIVDSLYLDSLREGPPPSSAYARLLRYRISLADLSVTEEPLSDAVLELPRIDYRERNTRPYRYVYGTGAHDDGDAPDFVDQLVKIDVESGEALTWFEEGSYPGEPVFVPSPDPHRAEDDGVLLSVVLDGREGRSHLLALDASTLEELGRARVPHHIPVGFHGQYFS